MLRSRVPLGGATRAYKVGADVPLTLRIIIPIFIAAADPDPDPDPDLTPVSQASA